MPDNKQRNRTGTDRPVEPRTPVRKDDRSVLIEDLKRQESVMQDDPTPFDTTPQTPPKSGSKSEENTE